jgi:hypothetical protein
MDRQIKDNMEEWKDRIRAEWEESKNYPRKKKKKVRKSLLLDWSIASWNPMEGMFNFDETNLFFG